MNLQFKDDDNQITLSDIWKLAMNQNNQSVQEEFDSNQFFQNLNILLQSHHISSLMQIIQQIHLYDMSELFCVLNSQLFDFIFREISSFSPESPKEYVMACLTFCCEITLLKKVNKLNKKANVFNPIIDTFSAFITPDFIKNIIALISNSEFTVPSLWIFANTFIRNEEIFQNYLSHIDLFQMLQQLSTSDNHKITSICSLILKRLLKSTLNSYFHDHLQNWIEIFNILLHHDHLFTQFKCIQSFSKLIRHFYFSFSLDSNEAFNQLIIEIISTFFNVDDSLLFGSTLLLILSIIETLEYKQNSPNPNPNDPFTPFLSNIPIPEIIKTGFLSKIPFIQEATSALFSFLITLDSPFTLFLVSETDIIESLFNAINDSCYQGKEKMKTSVLHIFQRNDLSQVYIAILSNGGYSFLCDSLNCGSVHSKEKIIRIFSQVLILFPGELISIVNDDLFDQLTEIVESDDKIAISAQALLDDLHSYI